MWFDVFSRVFSRIEHVYFVFLGKYIPCMATYVNKNNFSFDGMWTKMIKINPAFLKIVLTSSILADIATGFLAFKGNLLFRGKLFGWINWKRHLRRRQELYWMTTVDKIILWIRGVGKKSGNSNITTWLVTLCDKIYYPIKL